MNFTLPERIVALPSGPDGTPIDKTLRPYDPNAADPAREMEHRPFSPSDYAAPRDDARPAGLPAVAAGPAPKKRERAQAEFIGERARGRMFTLEHPLRVNGVEYRETRIASPMGSKFGEFQALRDDGVEDEDLVVWLISDLPIEVVENLAFEDKLELKEQGVPFLPRRMRAMIKGEPTGEEQTTSETT